MKKGLIFLIITLLISVAYAKEFHVAKSGNDNNPGTKSHPFLTINWAASIAKAGDIITVHSGTFREEINPVNSGLPGKPIIYQAAKGEQVEIKGSERTSTWEPLKNGIWRLTLPNSYFKGNNPYQEHIYGDWFFPGQKKLHTGEIYLDGKALYEADSLAQVLKYIPAAAPYNVDAESLLPLDFTWFTENSNSHTIIYAHFGSQNPNQKLTEINVRKACFYPAKTHTNYITVRGFTMSQAATNWAAPTAEQVGAIGTNWSKGWIIENNIIHDSKCSGITLGKDRASAHNPWSANPELDGADIYNQLIETVIHSGWNKDNIGSHTVRKNTIYNCMQAGICGSFGAAFSSIENNHIYDIYTRRGWWGAEMGGIKLHAAIDSKIKNNVIHNTNIGIWLDWMAQGTEVEGNVCYENDYVDLFPEVNHGPYLIADNYFLSPFSLKDWSEGGAYVNNYFAGLLSRKPQDRKTPYFEPNSTNFIASVAITGGDNLFIGNSFYHNGHEPFTPMPGCTMPADGLDSLSSYGLKHYQNAVHPITEKDNRITEKRFRIRRTPAGGSLLTEIPGSFLTWETKLSKQRLAVTSPIKILWLNCRPGALHQQY